MQNAKQSYAYDAGEWLASKLGNWAYLFVVLPFLAGFAALCLFLPPGEEIVYLQSVRFQVKEGEPLFIGYKLSKFGVGINHISFSLYLRGDGYVLGSENDRKRYYKLPADQIGVAQLEGSLPSQFPPYTISVWSYLEAYSGWVLIAASLGVVFGWSFIDKVGFLKYWGKKHTRYGIQLGRMYVTGNGVAEDNVEALKWFCIAASVKGDSAEKAVAAKECDAIAAKLSPEQIAMAMKRAREEFSGALRSS